MSENRAPIQITIICGDRMQAQNTKAAFLITLDADGDPIVTYITRECSAVDEFVVYSAIRRYTEKIETKNTRFKKVYAEAVNEGLFTREENLNATSASSDTGVEP